MRKGNLGALLLCVITFSCFTSNAHAIAVTITPNLTLSASDPIGQGVMGPCVIGDNSCTGVAGMHTVFGPTMGQTGNYLDVFSPLYSVSDLVSAAGGSMFSIGIDINTSNGANVGPHFLQTFVANINGVQTYAYDGGMFGTPLDPLNNPGNGFSDWQLGIFDLSTYLPTDTIDFGVDLLNVSGGQDQFFVLQAIDDPVGVPEPTSMALMGLGLVGLGLTRRKRKTS